MTNYIDIYSNLELNAILNDFYEIQDVKKITELSRELRTFFNCKAQVIQLRFRSNVPSNMQSIENSTSQEFQAQKKEIESLSNIYISFLKSIQKEGVTFKQEIQLLQCEINTTNLKTLLSLTEKVSILIHSFSEEKFRDPPRFLKIIVKLAQIISLVKSYLFQRFYKFYEELELNYSILDEELEVILDEMPRVKKIKSLKQLEERLPS